MQEKVDSQNWEYPWEYPHILQKCGATEDQKTLDFEVS